MSPDDSIAVYTQVRCSGQYLQVTQTVTDHSARAEWALLPLKSSLCLKLNSLVWPPTQQTHTKCADSRRKRRTSSPPPPKQKKTSKTPRKLIGIWTLLLELCHKQEHLKNKVIPREKAYFSIKERHSNQGTHRKRHGGKNAEDAWNGVHAHNNNDISKNWIAHEKRSENTIYMNNKRTPLCR